jgi:hypothetical protein
VKTLTDQQIAERAEIVWDSDTLCACGADPKHDNGAAIDDPRWLIEYADGRGVVGCPACLRENEADPERAWEQQQVEGD